MTKHITGTREQWLAAPRLAARGGEGHHAALPEEQQREGGIEYTYRREAGAPLVGRDTASWQASEPVRKAGGEGPVAEMAAMTGTDVATYTRERPGMSALALDDGVVYHT